MNKNEWNKYLDQVKTQLRAFASDREFDFVSAEVVVTADPRTGEAIAPCIVVVSASFSGSPEHIAQHKLEYTAFLRAVALAGRAEGIVTAMEAWTSAEAARTKGAIAPSTATDRQSALVCCSEHREHGAELSMCAIDDGPPRTLAETWQDSPGAGGGGRFNGLLPEPWMLETPNLVELARNYCRARLEEKQLETLYDRMKEN